MPWPYYQGPSSSQPTIAQSSSSGSSSVSFMRHQKERGPVNLQSTTSEKGSKKATPLMPPSDQVNTISVDDEDVCPICLEGNKYFTFFFLLDHRCWETWALSLVYYAKRQECPLEVKMFPSNVKKVIFCRIYEWKSSDNYQMRASLSLKLHLWMEWEKQNMSSLFQGNIFFFYLSFW